MFEVVDVESREGYGYFVSEAEACCALQDSDEAVELWRVADDEVRTRVLLLGTCCTLTDCGRVA